VEVLESLEAGTPDTHAMQVAQLTLSDTMLRMRFRTTDLFSAAMDNKVSDPDVPTPIFELWNSEVGVRSVGFRAGIFRMVDGLSLPYWSDHTNVRWIHRGSSERIHDEMETAYATLAETAKQVAECYATLRFIMLEEPAYDIIDGLDVSNRVKVKAKELWALMPADTQLVATSVVDAIALAAQAEPTLELQADVELKASQLMHSLAKA
jgi:hypothetical protein